MLSDIRIPLWLTEVDVLEQDPVKRADNLETVMRCAFSTPSVQGMILWSFWNYSSWRGPYTSLVDGNDWQVRENVNNSGTHRYLTFIGRGWAKYRNLSVASRIIICISWRLRQITDLRDTEKPQYFAIKKVNNRFTNRSPSSFSLSNSSGKRSAILHIRAWLQLRTRRT